MSDNGAGKCGESKKKSKRVVKVARVRYERRTSRSADARKRMAALMLRLGR